MCSAGALYMQHRSFSGKPALANFIGFADAFGNAVKFRSQRFAPLPSFPDCAFNGWASMAIKSIQNGWHLHVDFNVTT